MNNLSGTFHFELDAKASPEHRVSAWLVQHPGCIASGATHAEALEKLSQLMPGYTASLSASGVTTHDSAVTSTAVYDFGSK